jgi:hypothetical protein
MSGASDADQGGGLTQRIRHREQTRDLVAALMKTKVFTELLNVTLIDPEAPVDRDYLESCVVGWRPHLSRGARARTVTSASAVSRLPLARFYWQPLLDAGVQLATASDVVPKLLVLDRELAVLEDPSGAFDAVVTRDPDLIDEAVRSFEAYWDTGRSVATADERSALERQVMELLLDGATDQVAARRLHISERTVRRIVAAKMELHGATTRMQLGAHAGDLLR